MMAGTKNSKYIFEINIETNEIRKKININLKTG